MGLDTECDLAIEPRGDRRVAAGIAAFRDRLLAEHLGATPREVAAAIDQSGSLIGAIDRLGGPARTLVAMSDDDANGHGVALTDIAPVDLERPVAHAPSSHGCCRRGSASRSCARPFGEAVRCSASCARRWSGDGSGSGRSWRTRRRSRLAAMMAGTCSRGAPVPIAALIR